MASLVSVGGLTVATTSTGQAPQVDTFGNLKRCAARIVDGEDQSKILSLAGGAIQSAVNDTNMRRLFRFGRKSASDATLTDGTATYGTASDFFAMSEVQLINSDSEVAASLGYVPWDQFNELEPLQDQDGKPAYWTVKNSFDDEQIILYPTPDATAASDYTLRLTYYERITYPSADEDIIDAPRELGDVLCTYAKMWVLMHVDPMNPQIMRLERLWRDKLQQFGYQDSREPAANLQFRIKDADDDFDTTMYIKV